MNIGELTDKLGLKSINDREWFIQGTCAVTGDGIYDGLDWLSKTVKNKK